MVPSMIRSIYCFDISHITNLLPKSIAAFAVVPDPAKGSKMTSFLKE